PDGRLIAGANETGHIWVGNVAARHTFAVFNAHAKPVRALAFSPDGTMLAAGSDDKSVSLRPVVTWNNTLSVQAYPRDVLVVAISGAATTIASADINGTIKFWRRDTLKNIAEHAVYEDGNVRFALSPDGATLASTGKAKLDRPGVHFWELQTG